MANQSPVPQANIFVIWAAFLAGHFFYGFLPQVLVPGYEGPAVVMPDLSQPMELVMLIIALLACATGGVIAFRLMKDPREQFVLFVIQNAALDAVSVCGLVTAVVSKVPAKAIPFLILGVVVHLVTATKLRPSHPPSLS